MHSLQEQGVETRNESTKNESPRCKKEEEMNNRTCYLMCIKKTKMVTLECVHPVIRSVSTFVWNTFSSFFYDDNMLDFVDAGHAWSHSFNVKYTYWTTRCSSQRDAPYIACVKKCKYNVYIHIITHPHTHPHMVPTGFGYQFSTVSQLLWLKMYIIFLDITRPLIIFLIFS